MKSIKLVTVLASSIFLFSCAAGVNFVKPADEQLVLGSTTKEQIISLMGKPNGRGQKVSNGENLQIINYAYAKVGDKAVFKGVTPARSVGFLFHNNVLVGREFTSSFKSDNTYFDPEIAKSIKQGMGKRAVIALLGKPGGEYCYPLVANKSGKALVYIFTQTKGFKSQENVLVVELDKKGVVQRSEFNQFGQL